MGPKASRRVSAVKAVEEHGVRRQEGPVRLSQYTHVVLVQSGLDAQIWI